MSDAGATITAIVIGHYSDPKEFANHVAQVILKNATLDFTAKTVSPHPETRDFSGTIYKPLHQSDVPEGIATIFMRDPIFGNVQILITEEDVRVTYDIS